MKKSIKVVFRPNDNFPFIWESCVKGSKEYQAKDEHGIVGYKKHEVSNWRKSN